MRESLGYFLQILRENPFPLRDHLLKEKVSNHQNQVINLFYQALYSNLRKETAPIAFGGKLNKEKFYDYKHQIEEKLSELKTQKEKKDLKIKYIQTFWDQFFSLLVQNVENICAIQMPVKNLPFKRLFFCIHPIFTIEGRLKPEIRIKNWGFSISGMLRGIVPSKVMLVKQKARKTLVFRDKESQIHFLPSFYKPSINKTVPSTYNDYSGLFNYHIQKDGTLQEDIEKYIKNIDTEKEIKLKESGFLSFLNADKQITKNGKELSLNNTLSTRYHSGKGKNIKILGLLSPNKTKKRTLCVIFNHDYPSFPSIYHSIFTISHMGAASYEYPYTRVFPKNEKKKSPFLTLHKEYQDEDIPKQFWSQNELDELANKRGILNLPKWDAEKLERYAHSRGFISLEEWTEKELEEFNNKRHLPKYSSQDYWEQDENLFSCPKCGYFLQPNWKKCPVCGNPISGNLRKKKHIYQETREQKKAGEEKKEQFWKPPKS